MKARPYLRTIDLAHAAHISVQQVRNYESDGFIPRAERSPSGYRRYTEKHLAALHTARSLVGGYGWQRARAAMHAVHAGRLPAALALIDERHAELADARQQVEQTLAALSMLAAQSVSLANPRPSHPHYSRPLRVGEAAALVGVRVSALHFWEQQGLLHPTRHKDNQYRLYDEQQMRRLRVVVLLRNAGYDFDAIRSTLDELAAGRPERAIAAVEQRRAELARMSWACVTGMASFQGYISEFWPSSAFDITS
jgi:DNA-binding transcriptional MerR regulator